MSSLGCLDSYREGGSRNGDEGWEVRDCVEDMEDVEDAEKERMRTSGLGVDWKMWDEGDGDGEEVVEEVEEDRTGALLFGVKGGFEVRS